MRHLACGASTARPVHDEGNGDRHAEATLVREGERVLRTVEMLEPGARVREANAGIEQRQGNVGDALATVANAQHEPVPLA